MFIQCGCPANCTVFSVKMQLLYWTKSAGRVERHYNHVNWMNLTCVLFTLHTATTYKFSMVFLCGVSLHSCCCLRSILIFVSYLRCSYIYLFVVIGLLFIPRSHSISVVAWCLSQWYWVWPFCRCLHCRYWHLRFALFAYCSLFWCFVVILSYDGQTCMLLPMIQIIRMFLLCIFCCKVFSYVVGSVYFLIYIMVLMFY